MPRIQYFLVQLEEPATYTLVLGNAIADINEGAFVQTLLDDASKKIPKVSRGAYPRWLEAYTLVNSVSFAQNKPPLSEVEKQLGLNASFFKSNSTLCDPLDTFKTSDVIDGKQLVLFGVSGVSAKRPAPSVAEPIHDRQKRTKLATIAPSSIAKPSQYEILQKSTTEKILDDLPEPDADMPPIALLYEGFGEFLDICDGSTDIQGLSEVKMAELQSAVDDLARKMCCFYDDEDKRRDKGLPALNAIFSARTGNIAIPGMYAASIGSARSDGHSLGKHGGGVTATEFKNKATGINAIPEVELASYVAHLGVKIDASLFERWRVPCLGMTVVGATITFYAIISIDQRYRVVPLTPTLRCTPSASGGRDRKALYNAFAAASVLQARIIQDIDRFMNCPPPIIDLSVRHFPSITTLRKWKGLQNWLDRSSSDTLSFQISNFHHDRQSSRFLYLAETGSDKQVILIKFVQQYSIALHDFCALRGKAPEILAFDTLPGGWMAIAMELITGTMITSHPQLKTKGEHWTNELRTLVGDFHEAGFVHGDLRDANIMCDNDGNMILLDFDWGGLNGKVSYPTPRLTPELLEGRTSTSLVITVDDDNRVLEKTLEKLKM